MKHSIVLLYILALARIISATSGDHALAELDSKLSEGIVPGELESGMERAHELMKDMSKSSGEKSATSDYQIGVLRLLLSLEEMKNSKICDKSSYDLAENLHDLHLIKSGKALSETKQLDSLFYSLWRIHALNCTKSILASYRKKIQSLDQLSVERATTFAADIARSLRAHRRQSKKQRSERRREIHKDVDAHLLTRIQHFEGEHVGAAAYTTLQHLSGESDLKILQRADQSEDEGAVPIKMVKKRVSELVTKYIVAPCNYFVNNLKGFVRDSKKAGVYFRGSKSDKATTVELLDLKFHVVTFELCQLLVGSKKRQTELMTSVVNFASEFAE